MHTCPVHFCKNFVSRWHIIVFWKTVGIIYLPISLKEMTLHNCYITKAPFCFWTITDEICFNRQGKNLLQRRIFTHHDWQEKRCSLHIKPLNTPYLGGRKIVIVRYNFIFYSFFYLELDIVNSSRSSFGSIHRTSHTLSRAAATKTIIINVSCFKPHHPWTHRYIIMSVRLQWCAAHSRMRSHEQHRKLI